MIDIETRLTEHLRERAAAVDVRNDLTDVVAGASVPARGAEPRRPRGAVTLAAAAMVVVGIASIALVAGRDPAPSGPAEAPLVESSPPSASVTVPPSVTVFPILRGAGETYGSYVVPAHAPTTRLIVGTYVGDGGWRDSFTVTALNDPEGDAPGGGRVVDIDGLPVIRAEHFGRVLWFWTVGDVGIQVETDLNADPPAVNAIHAARVSDTDPPQLEVDPLPAGQVVLDGPTASTGVGFPTAATTDGGRTTSVEVRDDGFANSLFPGDYDRVSIDGAPGLVSTRLAARGAIVAWPLGDRTVVLYAAGSTSAEAVDLARRVELVDKATWDAAYEHPLYFTVPALPETSLAPSSMTGYGQEQ